MSNESKTSRALDNPGTRLPPPIFLIAVMLPGFFLQQLWTLELANGPSAHLAAWVPIGAAVFILISGWVQFFRAKTSVMHHGPASSLIQGGLYRFSRNPIYVSALLLQLGIALMMNNLWVVLLIPASKVVLERYVIAGEEAYLERMFGEAYLDYKRSVRRWL